MINEINRIWDKIANEKYIVLRNYENIYEDVLNGGDIDILCENRIRIIEKLEAIPRFTDIQIYNNKVITKKGSIAIDIREIGDNYFDAKWERAMLNNRIVFKKYYVPQKEDYVYSLLYHILIHKKQINSKYESFLLNNFGTLEEKKLGIILSKYLKEKDYKLVIPLDKGVQFNEMNYELLSKF